MADGRQLTPFSHLFPYTCLGRVSFWPKIMETVIIVACVIGLLLLGYLFFALFKGEDL
jgi:K+-transporting ATPase KdpF subunit